VASNQQRHFDFLYNAVPCNENDLNILMLFTFTPLWDKIIFLSIRIRPRMSP
jgi:hypothetical protein